MAGHSTDREYVEVLDICHLTIQHGKTPLLSKVNLHVAAGEIVTIMGDSGSGKSTLLNWMIGDLPSAFSASGTLELHGRRCDTLPTELRRIGVLFQDDVLFLHLSVGQNLAFALPARFKGRQERRKQVELVLAEIDLAGFHDRDPATLSGGQRARVSLMRALLAEPLALLLDEPFSKLDMALRQQFRALVYGQIARLNIPTVLVTHDLADVPPAGRVCNLNQWQPNHA